MTALSGYRSRLLLTVSLSILVVFGYLDLRTVSSLSARLSRPSSGTTIHDNHRNAVDPFSPSTTTAPTTKLANNPSLVSRRDWLVAGSVGASGLLWKTPPAEASVSASSQKPKLGDEYFTNAAVTDPEAGRSYFPALTPPFSNRATYRYDLGRNAWALEQLLTFANVTATIRCNVVRLESTGGLWVHSPQWPTGEFCSLLDSIGGAVEHVILPCNAFEHKAPMKAFLEKYPTARVWIAPGQYGPLGKQANKQTTKHDIVILLPRILTLLHSFFLVFCFVVPIQGSCGTTLSGDKPRMGYKVDGILGDQKSPPPPWVDEFDIATLYIDLPRNAGPVSEVAFCHRPSKTLITTDAVVYVPNQASGIISTYFDQDTMKDTNFWPKSVLQAVFLPLRAEETTNGSGSVYYPGYEAIVDRLARAPILRAVVDARAPNAVKDWILEQTTTTTADAATKKWDYDRVITSHFASPIRATPADVRASFDYLFQEDLSGSNLPPIACRDWELLDSINKFIAEYNAGEPAVFDFQRGCVAD